MAFIDAIHNAPTGDAGSPSCEYQTPRLPQPIIEVAWRHSDEVGKIHYRAKRPDGSNRHLIVREGEALYELLEQHLKAIGYSGPKSSAEGTSEH